MCTVSWLPTQDGYELFFNRDELRTRQPAQPAALHTLNGVRYLAPTDGDKGGTWLGINEYGVTVGLLNRYADPIDRTREYDSRGWLVRDALVCVSPLEVAQFLASQDLTRFPPFTLVTLARFAEPTICHWSGQTLWLEPDAAAALPLSSSSFLPAEVTRARQQYFRQLMPNGTPDAATLRVFHHSHEPARGAYSVCMHRDDAQTVSFSHIKVTAESVEFAYHDGPPCAAKPQSVLTLELYGFQLKIRH